MKRVYVGGKFRFHFVVVVGFYFFFAGPLGGVTGLPELIPAYWYLAFFSDGFRICKENNTLKQIRSC